MTALLAMLCLVAMGFVGGAYAVAIAQAPPAPPAGQVQTQAPPPPGTLPDWVAKYAGMQEQQVRACQIQLSQEQVKIDELTKQLADAQKAAAAAPKK